jgi:hypothetical protein
VMSTVPPARAGMASATLNTTRQVGGVFGIAVLGAVVMGRFVSEVRAVLATLDLPPFVTERIVEMAEQGRGAGGGSIPTVPGIDTAAIQKAVQISFTTGMHQALWIAGVVVLAGAVIGAVMIRGTSPRQQMARHAAARAALEASAGPVGQDPLPLAGPAVAPAPLSEQSE